MKYGRSPDAVKKLMRTRGIKRKAGKLSPGPRVRSRSAYCSSEHVAIGVHMVRWRGQETKTAFAGRLGTSAHRLSQMEAGRHDFTLSELRKIEDVVGRPLFTVTLSATDGAMLH